MAGRSSSPRRCARSGSTRAPGRRWATRAREARAGLRLAPGRGARHRGLREGGQTRPSRQPLRARGGEGHGLRPADMSPRRPARRLESLEPGRCPTGGTRRARIFARRPSRARSGSRPCSGSCSRSSRFGGVGFDNVFSTLVESRPSWVVIALALFSTSMILRALSWFEIVRAALPDRPVKRRTILSGTVIGVLDVGDAPRAPR